MRETKSYFRIISGPMIILGRNVEIQGTYVTKIKKINKTPRKGRAALTTDIIGIPATPEVTKRFNPTGGVIMPIGLGRCPVLLRLEKPMVLQSQLDQKAP